MSIDVLNVELQAILSGLKLAWETGNRVICCETDSYEAYCILSTTNSANRDGVGALCQEIRDWLNRDWSVQLKHVYRSANMVADGMAKLGTSEQEPLRVWQAPPACVIQLLAADLTAF